MSPAGERCSAIAFDADVAHRALADRDRVLRNL
jgi:hypothetical protein